VTMTTTRQLASVTRMQRAAGVVAAHHDARTEPQPMTAESLSASGSSAPPQPPVAARTAAPVPVERRHRATTPRRRGSVAHLATRAGSPRAAVGGRRVAQVDSGRRSDPSSRKPPAPARARSGNGSTARTKKPRWTAAERRAGSKR
jgi:hypothetical protein